MGFSRQEYWSGLPYPPPGDLPDPEIEPVSLMSPALAGRFFTTSISWEAGQRHTFYFFKKLTFEYMYDCFSNLQFYLLFYFPLFALIIFCCLKKFQLNSQITYLHTSSLNDENFQGYEFV